jgi:predicted nucleotidyltransferase
MRITRDTATIIRDTAAELFGAPVRLFGSRLDDQKRGGDIDLYVETDLTAEDAEKRRLRMLARLARRLGERKIDLVVKTPDGELPIHAIARREGVVL